MFCVKDGDCRKDLSDPSAGDASSDKSDGSDKSDESDVVVGRKV